MRVLVSASPCRYQRSVAGDYQIVPTAAQKAFLQKIITADECVQREPSPHAAWPHAAAPLPAEPALSCGHAAPLAAQHLARAGV